MRFFIGWHSPESSFACTGVTTLSFSQAWTPRAGAQCLCRERARSAEIAYLLAPEMDRVKILREPKQPEGGPLLRFAGAPYGNIAGGQYFPRLSRAG